MDYTQLAHPWHWLTYGQNATASAIFVAFIVNVITVIVLVRTLRAVNKQARAANRQTEAAEQQARSAMSATRVSEAQLRAFQESAKAEQLHGQLVRQAMLAKMRPFLVIVKFLAKVKSEAIVVENHGEGVALAVEAEYMETHAEDIQITRNIIGPDRSAELNVDWSIVTAKGIQVKYQSQDGRSFVTVLSAEQAKNGTLCQYTHEIPNPEPDRLKAKAEETK